MIAAIDRYRDFHAPGRSEPELRNFSVAVLACVEDRGYSVA